ncbi:hypothetical protein KEM09_12995 [Carboxylicivirga mesophila]|uniref:Uncharacterized protein n=1 Tax=Carboxylicivirga mesophila TaxID=1166478 RepID=A0ABS5KCS4_9BACT|nr:hypothetical protein [Carboxylicivirga mesophila]MBS2212326.1 hypothetical protein [Carboxylicivirga mesophila]
MTRHHLNRKLRLGLWLVIGMLINNMLNYHSKSIDVADQHNDIQSIIELALSIIDDNIEIADIEDEDSNSVKPQKVWACHTPLLIDFLKFHQPMAYPEYVCNYQSPDQTISIPPPKAG